MEPNEKRKALAPVYRALILFVVCTAALLILLPVGEALNPLRHRLAIGFRKLGELGGGLYGILITALGGTALRSLIFLVNRLTQEKAHFKLNWGLLFTTLVSLLLGIRFLPGDALFPVFGLALLGFGLWSLVRLIRDIDTQVTLSRGAETVIARMVSITPGSVEVNDHIVYTVRCEADGRYYEAKTINPYDGSYIGRKVPVQVSSTRPDVYRVQLDEIIWSEAEGDGTTPPEERVVFTPNPAAQAHAWRWGDTEKPVSLTAEPAPVRTATPPEERAAFTPNSAAQAHAWRWGDTEKPGSPTAEPAPVRTESVPDRAAQPEAPASAPEAAPPVTGKGTAAEEKPAEPFTYLHTQDFIRIPWDMFLAAAMILAPFWFIGFLIAPWNGSRSYSTGGWALGMLIAALPSLIIVLFGVRSLLRQRRLFLKGTQVRARVVSAESRGTYNDNPVYRVTCKAGSESFTGKVRLPVRDPALVGKNITVFVSPKNPKDYIIEGRTASYS